MSRLYAACRTCFVEQSETLMPKADDYRESVSRNDTDGNVFPVRLNALICRGLVDVVDDEEVDGATLGGELEAELLAHGVED